MDIDPDVAELLREPPPTLPRECVEHNWGFFTVRTAQLCGDGTLKEPGTEFQPTYNATCIQCGRPITNARANKGWMDHAGHVLCDADLIEERISTGHVTAFEADIVRTSWAKRRLEIVEPHPPLGPCDAIRTSMLHVHRCEHPTGHFGMHECSDPTCRHLWL